MKLTGHRFELDELNEYLALPGVEFQPGDYLVALAREQLPPAIDRDLARLIGEGRQSRDYTPALDLAWQHLAVRLHLQDDGGDSDVCRVIEDPAALPFAVRWGLAVKLLWPFYDHEAPPGREPEPNPTPPPAADAS
ncbi:MAG: hypothetical protein KKB13_27840 [Chloroflexi bacterium]|nr:hypothetical protein [Chloroflexota bacterium]